MRSEPTRPRPGPTVVGIVGAGTMGAGIAQVALEAGARVLLHDVDPSAVDRARARIADGLARRMRRLASETSSASAPGSPAVIERLVAARDLESLAREADLVIEAALEDLELKRRVFARLDAAGPPGTILATNTSALSVGAIAEAAATHPERVVGLHFFNPAPLMTLVEVVAPPGADPAVVAAATTLMSGWGKTPVRSADAPGFIVNRVNRPFTLEALRLLEDGHGSVEGIDAAVRGEGFPMGPFELMDLVGIDVNLAAARGIWEAFRYEPRFRPSPIQERLVEAGRLGRKTGEGFYWYGDDGRRIGPAGAFIVDDGAVEEDAVDPPIERIVVAIANEAYRALGEGVGSEADIDLALRLGAGHPRGPFEQVERWGGAGAVVEALRRIAAQERDSDRFEPAPLLLEAAAPR